MSFLQRSPWVDVTQRPRSYKIKGLLSLLWAPFVVLQGGYCWEDKRVCMWFESRWAQQLARAEQEVLGVARPIPYKHHIMALPSKKPAWEAKCTLVTQAS